MLIKDVRSALKVLGFSVKVETLSWGPHATFKDASGRNMPSIFFNDGPTEGTREYWLPVIEFKQALTEDVTMPDGRVVYGFGQKHGN